LALNVECWQAWDRRLPSASVLETKEEGKGKVIHWQVKYHRCDTMKIPNIGVYNNDILKPYTGILKNRIYQVYIRGT